MRGQPIVGTMAAEAASDDRTERLAALFDAHSDRLFRLARRLTPTADEARDLVQETFLRAAAARKPVPIGAANEEAWLVRVLVNIRRDQWRTTAGQKTACRDPLTRAAHQSAAGLRIRTDRADHHLARARPAASSS